MLTQFDHYRKSFPSFFLLGVVMLSLSGCGLRWPEWATFENDPFSFTDYRDDGSGPDTPAPPNMIPKDEPDQTAPEFEFLPASTMEVNLDTYLVQDIQDPMTRIQRLENVVLALHKDMQRFSNMAPPRMVNSGMISHHTPPAPPAHHTAQTAPPQVAYSSAPVPLVPAHTHHHAPIAPAAYTAPSFPATSAHQTVITPGSKVMAGSPIITGVRVGDHPNKVRVVLDVTAKTNFRADLDNNENILLIEVPYAQWKTPLPNPSFRRIPILKSFKAEPFNNGKGVLAGLQLKKNTSILAQGKYPALSGSGERIVIDLRK